MTLDSLFYVDSCVFFTVSRKSPANAVIPMAPSVVYSLVPTGSMLAVNLLGVLTSTAIEPGPSYLSN